MVRISESYSKPHIASDKKFYFRLGSISQPMDYYLVKKLFESNAELENKLEKEIHQRIKKSWRKNLDEMYIQFIACPYELFKSIVTLGGKTEIQSLTSFVINNFDDVSGEGHLTQIGYTFEKSYDTNESKRFFAIERFGLLEYGTSIKFKKSQFFNEDNQFGIYYERIKNLVLQFTNAMIHIYKTYQYVGKVRFLLFLDNIEGIYLLQQLGGFNNRKVNAPMLEIGRDIHTEDLKNNPKAFMNYILLIFLQSFGVEIFNVELTGDRSHLFFA